MPNYRWNRMPSLRTLPEWVPFEYEPGNSANPGNPSDAGVCYSGGMIFLRGSIGIPSNVAYKYDPYGNINAIKVGIIPEGYRPNSGSKIFPITFFSALYNTTNIVNGNHAGVLSIASNGEMILYVTPGFRAAAQEDSFSLDGMCWSVSLYDPPWNFDYYDLTFNGNGAETNPWYMNYPQIAANGGQTAIRKNTYTRNGFNFSGWNTAPDGSGTAYADQANITLTKDTVLYAQWTPV